MMDKMADLMERSEEINEIIGRSYENDDYVDEEELEQELDLMGDELLLGAGDAPSSLTSGLDTPALSTDTIGSSNSGGGSGFGGGSDGGSSGGSGAGGAGGSGGGSDGSGGGNNCLFFFFVL